MDWPADHRAFVDLFAAVANGFRQFYPGKTTFFLDFEYKKDLNLGRVVKQVRQVPQPGTTNEVVPFLIDEPYVCSVQQRGSTAFASHRLKSLWNLHTRNIRLSNTNLASGIYTDGSLEYVENGTTRALSGPLNGWPNASNSPAGNLNTWTTGTGPELRRWELATTIISSVTGDDAPILTPQDLARRVTVTYSQTVSTVSGLNPPTATNCETALLQVQPLETASAVLQQRRFGTNNVDIQTSYYWPKPPGGVVAGYTAPLLRFVETRITGLVTTAIVLTNHYSQTYGAFHHNFYEEFIFEPRLEPGIAPETLAELEAANIQLIYVFAEGNRGLVFYALGLDGKFRTLR